MKTSGNKNCIKADYSFLAADAWCTQSSAAAVHLSCNGSVFHSLFSADPVETPSCNAERNHPAVKPSSWLRQLSGALLPAEPALAF